MTFLEAALAYASKGWYVFPIAPGQKSPPLCKWRDDSTTDPETITAYWGNVPDANIGLDCGKSGIFAVDIDDKADYTALSQRIGGFPTTPTSRSGSGRGGHLLFKQPSVPLTNTEGALVGYHVNYRGQGGYIVLPPGVHPSGGVYSWSVPPFRDTPFAEVPQALIDLLNASPAKKREALSGKILEGQGRQSYLFHFGMSLLNKDFVDDEIRAKMSAENQTMLEPPLDPKEFDHTIAQVLGYRGRTHAYFDKWGREPLNAWEKKSQAELRYIDFPEVEWDIQGLLPKDVGPAFLIGAPGSYKSWIALHAAYCSASGEQFLGKYPVLQRGNSIYVNLDAGIKPFARRMKMLPGSLTNLTVINPGYWDWPNFEKMLAANVGAFVVVDCFSDLYEGAQQDAYESEAKSMRRILKQFRTLYEQYHCNGFVIDHSKRDSENDKSSKAKTAYFGSVQKKAAIRSMWHISVPDIAPEDEPAALADPDIHVRIACAKQSEAEDFRDVDVTVRFAQGQVTFNTLGGSFMPPDTTTSPNGMVAFDLATEPLPA